MSTQKKGIKVIIPNLILTQRKYLYAAQVLFIGVPRRSASLFQYFDARIAAHVCFTSAHSNAHHAH